ncbi:hypothetical protein V8F20_010939 [Naviculisporaceae sp. PSN 640]
MTSSYAPGLTTGRTPPLHESQHLLHGDITAAAPLKTMSDSASGAVAGTESTEEKKKQCTASVVAVDHGIQDDLNDHGHARRVHTYSNCHHRPHRKPWAFLADIIRGPYRSFYMEHREVPKTVLSKASIPSLFAHLWVHIIPVVATGALIGMNLWNPRGGLFEGWYIGPELWGPWGSEATLNFLQLAAKLHETVIVASITAVVVDLVRYFLVYKPLGVPLGLLGAGSRYGDMKYLLSKELHAIWKTKYRLWAKVAVFMGIIFFCSMANLVGPSSAILLIPRNHTWTVADFAFHVNGTREDHLWPTTLTADHIGGPNCGPGAVDQFKRADCVSGGYAGLANYFRPFIAYPVNQNFEFNIQDSRTNRVLFGSTRHTLANHFTETWTLAPHAATVAVSEPLRSGWNQYLYSVNHNFRFASERSVKVQSTSSAVRAACQPLRLWEPGVIFNDTITGEEMFSVDFPVLQEEVHWVPSPPVREDGNKTFDGGPTARVNFTTSLLDLDIDLDEINSTTQPLIVRSHWVQLPEHLFPFARTGLLLLMSAADSEAGHDTRMLNSWGCVADARWVKAENTADTDLSTWAPWSSGFQVKTEPLDHRPMPEGTNGHGDRMFLPSRETGWEPITLTPAWLEALTPPMSDHRSPRLTTSTIGALLEDWLPTLWAVAEHEFLKGTINGYTDSRREELVVGIEHAVANLVADGVSRVGLSMQGMVWDLARPLGILHGGDPNSEPPVPGNPDFSLGTIPLPAPYNGSAVKYKNGHGLEIDVLMGEKSEQLVMTAKVNGYGLRMAGRGGLFALVIMCTYLLVALLHVCFVLIAFRCRTMDAFESQTELLLLGMASRKGANDENKEAETEEMLACGGLGIDRAATYARVVRIGTATRSDNIGDQEGFGVTTAVQEIRLSLGDGPGSSPCDLGKIRPGMVYGVRNRK